MEITLLWGTWGLGILAVVVFFVMRQRAVAAWNRSGPGVLHAEAMGSWLLAKARLDSVSVLPEAPVVRAFYEGRLVGGRSRSVFVREERRAIRMSVQILPIGGGQAEENHRAQLAFSPMAGPQYR